MRRKVSVMEVAVISREHVVRNTVRRYLRNGYAEWIDDAVQDVLIKALEKINYYFSSEGSLDSWLYTMAKNHCLDLMRKNCNKVTLRAGLDDVKGLIDTPSFYEEFHAERRVLRECLDRLQYKDRLILSLRFYFGYRGPEIAKIMEIPRNQVAVMMQRAKDRLRKNMVNTLNDRRRI